jgi:hypothetical protein
LNTKSIVFLSILFLFVPLITNAQQNKEERSTIDIDTGLVYTRYTNLPINNKPLKSIDKSLSGVRHTNAIYKIEEMFYQQLSTEGSPHKPLLVKLPESLSLNYQPNLYDAMRFTKENIKFYNVYKPYSELRYSNNLSSSRYFSVVHGQNIYKNLQVGFQYDLNYTNGAFDKSQVMNQFFNATARYKNKTETYQGYLGFIRNRAMQSESGGLKSDSSFRVQQYSSLSAYPMNISSAFSKYKSKEVFLTQEFGFGKLISKNKFINSLSVIHDISYISNARIYNDLSQTEGFYQNTFFDSIATHDSLSTRHLQNIISIRNKQIIPFAIGLKHDYVLFADTLNQEKSSLFSPFFELGLDIKSFKLNFDYEFIISDSRYNKDYNMGARLDFKGFYAKLRLMEKSVDYFYTKYTTNNFIWSNDFEKTQMFSTNIGYNLKDKLIINLAYYTMENLAYIDQNLTPKVSNSPTHIYQASLLHNIKLWVFRLNGVMSLQKLSSEEAIRVPLFQAKQGISVNFKMFKKKLDTEIGFDFRYNTSYFADRYMPAMGAFVHQDQVKIGNYLFADFFIQAQLDRVKFFITLTHPYAGLFGNEYYLTPHYPAEKLNLRFGIAWRFFD